MSREDYGEGMRSRGEPIPGSTGHEHQARPVRTNPQSSGRHRMGPATANEPSHG